MRTAVGVPSDDRARFGIAFEGCGCRAAFHVGVIEWFTEHDLVPHAVAGASSGALIAGGQPSAAPPIYGRSGRSCSAAGSASFRRLLRRRWPYRMSEIVGGVAAGISAIGSWPTR